MTERAARLKDYVVNQLGNAGVRSSRLYDMIAASLAESEGEHLETRRAKVSVYLYDHIGMVIHPYELLAGSQLALYPVDTNLPDYEQRKAQVKDYLDQYRAKRLSGEMPAFSMVSGWSEFDPGARRNSVRFALISRDHYEANIPYDQLQRLIREMQALYHDDEILLEAEIAREVENYFNYDYSHAYELMRKAHYTVANHLSYDHGRLLQRGFGSLRDQAKRGLADAQERKDADKARFYQAALITLAAAIRYIYRYADFAEAEDVYKRQSLRQIKPFSAIFS